MTRRIAILLALFAITLPLFAQKTTGTVAGRIDGAKKVELRRGVVIVAQTTTRDGRFRLEVPAGRYQLYIDGVSSRDVIVSPGNVSGLDGSHVDAESPLLAYAYDAKLLDQLPQINLLLLSPGLTRFSTYGSGTFSFLTDGIRPSLTLPTIPTEFLESEVAIHGGFPAEYGRVTAGMLNVATRNSISPFNASVYADRRPFHDAFGRTRAGVTFGGPIVRDRLFGFAAYERRRFDYHSPDPAVGNQHSSTESVLVRTDYLATPRVIVTASAIGNPAIRAAEGGGSVMAGGTLFEIGATHADLGAIFPYVDDRATDSIRVAATRAAGEHVIRAGAEAERREFEERMISNPPVYVSTRTVIRSSPAIWLADTWYAGQSIVVNGGVRSQSTDGSSRLEPRLAVMWQPAGGAVHVAAAYGTQSGNLQQFALGSHPPFISTSRDTLVEMSLPAAGVTARAIQRTTEYNGLGTPYYQPSGSSSKYQGVEVEWRRRVRNSWFRASWAHGEDRARSFGHSNVDSVKLAATTTLAKLDLGAAATYESGVPSYVNDPAIHSTEAAIDLRAAYRLLDSLTLIVDAINITDDEERSYDPRSIQAGIRWHL